MRIFLIFFFPSLILSYELFYYVKHLVHHHVVVSSHSQTQAQHLKIRWNKTFIHPTSKSWVEENFLVVIEFCRNSNNFLLWNYSLDLTHYHVFETTQQELNIIVEKVASLFQLMSAQGTQKKRRRRKFFFYIFHFLYHSRW
jgi:hypothetical protein